VLLLGILIGLSGCGDSPVDRFPVVEPPSRQVVVDRPKSAEIPTSPSAVVAPAAGEPVQIVLVWEGVANLHKGFFSEPDFVTQLGRDLAGHVQPPVNVYVSFDSKRHIGRILIRLLPDTGIGLWRGEGGAVDMAALSPALQALARYRGSVAQRFDTRVNAFHVGIESFRGAQYCRFGAAGKPPPDGTVVDRCVLLNGVEDCGVGDVQALVFPKASADQIERCLQ